MAKQLAVKAFLVYPEGLELGCSPDIRRFKLSREIADDNGDLYCRLVDTLHSVFPDIKGVNCSIYWKDDEGDTVEFHTKEELQTAIDAMSDHVLRVYVMVHFDESEDTTDTESEAKRSTKHVRFAKAGRRFRRKIRRRRKAALADTQMVSKEFRMGARLLVRHAHEKGQDGAEGLSPHDNTVPAADLSTEVRHFIQEMHTEWHSKLLTQRPTVVARRMRMKQRTLPAGMERDHLLWLVRLMGRWHRRHASLCRAMADWSSGDTDGDESQGEEGEMLLKTARKKRGQAHRRRAEELKLKREKSTAKGKESVKAETPIKGEQPPHQHDAPKEFRKAVRVLMKQIHKDGSRDQTENDDQEKATLAALTPEVQDLVRKLADDWHTSLVEKHPRRVCKRMKKGRRGKSLRPSSLTRDDYLWLCRYFRRWHRRHAALCPAMSGWSSGEDDDAITSDDGDEDEDEDGGGKGGDSSESDSDEAKCQEQKAVPKNFVKAVRVLVKRLHSEKFDGEKENKRSNDEQTTLAALSPEVQAFVQSFVEEWDSKLEHRSPSLVARRMKKRQRRSVPAGVEESHVQFLCRFLSRWHSKHAAACTAMSGWSSGDAGGDTSGEERWSRRRAHEDNLGSEQEDTDCMETACKPVSKVFRVEVRQWINKLHKLSTEGDKPKAKNDNTQETLSPEMQQFLQHFADDWHRKLSDRRPGAVSKEMKASVGSLPSRMEREQYNWLCCFMARWHRKHGRQCDVMADQPMASAQA